MITRPCLYSY